MLVLGRHISGYIRCTTGLGLVLGLVQKDIRVRNAQRVCVTELGLGLVLGWVGDLKFTFRVTVTIGARFEIRVG